MKLNHQIYKIYWKQIQPIEIQPQIQQITFTVQQMNMLQVVCINQSYCYLKNVLTGEYYSMSSDFQLVQFINDPCQTVTVLIQNNCPVNYQQNYNQSM